MFWVDPYQVCADLTHLSTLGDTLTVTLPPSGQMPPLLNGTPAAIGTHASFGTEAVMEMQVRTGEAGLVTRRQSGDV